MEAGSPVTAAPPPSDTGRGRASGGWRALGILLVLALAFAAVVMFAAMTDISDTPLEDDCVPPVCTEYFDGSSAEKAATVGLGYASGTVAGIGALLALYFVVTGRRGHTALLVAVGAVLLGGLSILISAI